MRFDWYGATIPSDADHVVGELAQLGDGLRDRRGLYGYERGVEVRLGTDVVAAAFWGGEGSRGIAVHVQASGEMTPGVVEVVRSRFSEHAVSRADACEDFAGPRAWRDLMRLALKTARRSRVKTAVAGDWLDQVDGRTLYVGGHTSRVRARVYEKGKQLKGADPDRVRVEVQVRPQGPGKQALARAAPAELWRSASWASEIADALEFEKFSKLIVRPAWRVSDEDRARWWLARSYGDVVTRWAEQAGSVEAFVSQIASTRNTKGPWDTSGGGGTP